MLISTIIERVDSLEPNQYSREEKYDWLFQLESRIKSDVYDLYEHKEQTGDAEDGEEKRDPALSFYNEYLSAEMMQESADFDSYSPLATAPYDRMYVTWLQSRIQYANQEYAHYNNSLAMFEAEYSAFRNWYNRNHTALQTGITYF